MKRRVKICDLCKHDINEETEYAKFKRNILFTEVDGVEDKSIWHGLMPVYICAKCVDAMRDYCTLYSRGRA